ncbi:hypothetical protein [Propionispora hippei]|uniref:rRNA biogenesis protein rrp5 n=1 Tax=Propionispora hippei DSM 15287 TaxID=1123003 RepID=A0A1M6GI26_9FIRM|nr:hypothetical protein [Propionispora hippei]SHJ09541.1 hypothetical protein SAMN02745170_01710 [Propionispora hippei DSM 15287]
MSEIYLTLADGFEKLAAGYRTLAANSAEGQIKEQSSAAELKQESKISIELVRAVLAEKSQEGKTREVKALLMKYDAGKLSGVKPEDYEALLKEAEVL